MLNIHNWYYVFLNLIHWLLLIDDGPLELKSIPIERRGQYRYMCLYWITYNLILLIYNVNMNISWIYKKYDIKQRGKCCQILAHYILYV
jgi:hypothetical protein